MLGREVDLMVDGWFVRKIFIKRLMWRWIVEEIT